MAVSTVRWKNPFYRSNPTRINLTNPSLEWRTPLLLFQDCFLLGSFSALWAKLQLREDITRKLLEWEKEPLNLMRLSQTVSRELASKHAEVVETCLFLGSGIQATHALEKAELDKIIFEEIVTDPDFYLAAVTFSSGIVV